MRASGYLGSPPCIALMSKGEEGVYFKILDLWYSLAVLLLKNKKIKNTSAQV